VIAETAARIVDFARRNAAWVTVAVLVLALAGGMLAAARLTIDTDIEHMLPSDVAWRQDEFALDNAFPQNNSLLVVVIDGKTPDLAEQAAEALAAKMRGEPQFFEYVRQPDGGPFFDQNGLLFLSLSELDSMSQDLVATQPLIGSMAHDPSLRGLFGVLATFVEAAHRGDVAIDKLNPTLTTIGGVVRSVLADTPASINWGQMLTGRAPEPRDLRRFVLTRPVLDFSGLQPGGKATAELRRLADDIGLDAQHGIRLRLTGPVALDDEQFATLQQGALRSTVLSIVCVLVILFAALRSVKLVGAVLVTLASGLLLTAGFAAAAIGSLNLISIAFGVLFIGLAVDFSIQFSIRYRDQRHRLGGLQTALPGAGRSIGPALVLAAGATAIGFLSFVPTPYSGIRELGWIAGVGMIMAIVLNFLLLPALLTLLRPRGEPEPIGFRRVATLDRFLLQRRGWVIGAATLLAIAGLALLPRLSFDFDPLDLKNPNSESVATARDLMQDSMTSPYAAEVLAPSLPDAEQLADRLAKLPEVAQAVTAASFIPEDQDKKLAIIEDLALLLGPTLTPVEILPQPDDAEVLKAIADCRDALRKVAAGAGPQDPASQLAQSLDAAVARGPEIVGPLREALLPGLEQRLAKLAVLLQAKPVSLASLPAELRDSWIAPDGRARVEVFPRGDVRDHANLERFVAAVRSVAPDATGTPVTIQEAGRLISSAFVQAGIIAVVAITILLALVLRRLREVALVVAPLLLSAVLALAVTVLLGIPLNYANIIALPLLLGIGVAFDIYFVMNWRAGQTHHLQSSTARAVVFSALTTMSAFGSLALSNDPGTSDMGQLLTISLACTLFCTLIVLPALLGPAPEPRTALSHAAAKAETADQREHLPAVSSPQQDRRS
jgi:hopanoid biosynthesis associated RND transporter like protein HpnN